MSLDLFKERLGNARREAGMTQAELARRLGVTAQAVSRWERGSAYPDIELLDGITRVLDCSPDYLFQYEKEAKSFAGQDSLERRAELEGLMLKDSVALWFGCGLVEMFLEEKKNKFASVHRMRREMAEKYGICVPVIRFADSSLCAPQEYKIFIYGREAASGTAELSKRFNAGKGEEKEDIAAVNPERNLSGGGTGTEASGDACDAMRVIMTHLEKCIMENLPSLFHCQMVADMVENVKRKYPKVVQGVVPERVSLSFLKQVLLILLCEKHYAVNHMIRIIEVLDEMADERPTAKKAAECAAAALGEAYSFSL